MAHKSTDHIASLAKGLRVLAAFGADRPRMSISQAATATGLDRATARRCLLTLYHEGYADYDGKFFTITHRALRLGQGALTALPMPQIVQPWLDQLTEQTGQSCSVAVLDDTEIVYIARAAQRRVMSIGLMPGSRLPAHCTAMGRVLLGALPDDEARRRICQSDLAPRTVNSLTDPDDIMLQVIKAREQGHALVDQEIEIGLRSIAVPLFSLQGGVVAALNTGVAAVHPDVSELPLRYLPHLKKAQAGLQRLL